MNECPTRVRTGVPPCSRTISGTARLVIRLWMIVAPGSRASSRVAISVVSTEGGTSSPRSSTTKQRSASPSKARPMSAPVARTLSCRSAMFAGSIGLASWFGNDPSSSKYIGTRSIGSPAKTDGTVCPAIPLPADLGQAAVPTDWCGPGEAELDAVVPGRVVAGGEHRAGDVEPTGGEVEQVGGGQAGQHHVGALAGRTGGEGSHQRRAGGAHVAPDDDLLGRGEPGEGRSGRLGNGVVELVRHDATDVVCLDDRGQIAHPAAPASTGVGTRPSLSAEFGRSERPVDSDYRRFCAFVSTEPSGSVRSPCSQILCSQLRQETKSTGEPSVSVMEISVTLVPWQAGQRRSAVLAASDTTLPAGRQEGPDLGHRPRTVTS